MSNSKAEDRIRVFLKDLGKTSLTYFLCPIITVSLITRFLFMIVYVPTGSMEPTLSSNSLYIVNRLAYHGNRNPQCNDIVVFKHPDYDNYLVKRVIATGGQTVSFEEGNVLLDGNCLNESFLPDKTTVSGDCKFFEVPKGCIFVMGDNRNASTDSRFWNEPYVKCSDCIGKIIKFS